MSAVEHVIPEGYKRSEEGLIPEDWEVKKFGQAMRIKHGKDQKTVQVDYGLYPIFGTGGQMGTAKIALYDKQSVLIGRKGTINKPRFIDVPFWTVDTLFYSVISDKESAKFIYYKFCLIDWMQYNEASGVPSLNARTIENISASFPALEEQTAIANALSDVDALLTELEKLMAKKQAIKTATMQQLLTGKTRLPQFATYTEGKKKGQRKGKKPSELGEIPEDWDVAPLGDLVSIQSGESPSKFQFISDGIPYFKVEQLNNGLVYAEETEYRVDTKKVVDAGSIIFPKRGASILLNKIRVLKNDSFMDTNLMTLTCSDKLNNLFLHNILTYKGLDQVADTTSIPQINNKHIIPFLIAAPNIEEQTAIATILSDMDNQIQILEQRLAKTGQIKQGMMQELLTGRTRLPFDGSDEESTEITNAN